MPLPGKSKIIVGITGGIAAYKACELVRLFKKAGHEVRVVMTASAENFVSALTFHSLSGEPVLRSLSEGSPGLGATSHIDLAQWGDILVIAPATANFIAKQAHGIADDALLTETLAFQGPVLVAPAMNTRMWDAPATQANLKILQSRGVQFIGPASGDLACGEVGAGKMSEPVEIYETAEKILSSDKPLLGKTVLITSGPTRAYIDRVRFITNRSSGRMGHAIAEAAEKLGANVVLVTGPVEKRFATLAHGKVIEVETGAEMLAACREVLASVDVVFATAAVADFEMPAVHGGKIRREGNLTLEMQPAVDVLAALGKEKHPGQIFFGFAAEAGEGAEEFAKAREKIRRKNLDYLALNNISRKDIGFDAQDNEVYLFRGSDSAHPEKLEKTRKTNLADTLLRTAFQLEGQK
jgi:phosphopantothenoylcysteine decarboxylase/phosphopantothenate--cysteine ligase